MKFGHDYVQILEREGFPTQWVHSAIAYRQLKKCIKKVRNELLELGLSPEVLNQLRQSGHPRAVGSEDDEDGTTAPSAAGFEYSFCRCAESCAFIPKLTLIVDSKDGSPIDAFLSPETREYLLRLSRRSSCAVDPERCEPGVDGDDGASREVVGRDAGVSSVAEEDAEEQTVRRRRSQGNEAVAAQAIEIPLSWDTEFFRILRRSIKALNDLQEQEQQTLDRQVRALREDIVKVANAPFRRTQHTMYAWREIFRLYIELQIFFSTDELTSGQRTATAASQQLEKFQAALAGNARVRKLKRNSRAALESFLRINAALLQNLKFQELNRVALTKILKKFDKQTALHARAAFPRYASSEPFLAESVAKAVCQSISQELLPVVPQIDDYLCPICLNVAFKPVRLRCDHVFCIRCLVIMQRGQQNQCPLCRAGVVMQATSENLDMKLLSFLSATFPKETKAKQKENERAATLELYGEVYGPCSVM
ncbi:hypothetical protein VTO42DRAFT_4340 [Malbranchea cinnamomea]